MLELKVRGPVLLYRDCQALRLPIRQTQALLLLLARGQAWPRARLVAWLWPDLEAATGRRNLRRELVRLREAGAEFTVQADSDNLRLDATVATDVQAFEAALQAQQADSALALWRGLPADGLELAGAGEFDDWLAQQRQSLAVEPHCSAPP